MYLIGAIKIWPYNRGRQRKYIKIGSRPNKWQCYSRYVMEKHLGRKLLSGELVTFIDGNPLNDNIDNLKISSRKEAQKGRWVANKSPNWKGGISRRFQKAVSISVMAKEDTR